MGIGLAEVFNCFGLNMADGDTEPEQPYKRFRGDYGQSDEERQSRLVDEVESGDEHRSPQQPSDQIYWPDSSRTQQLRFPDDRTDESYLVLETEEEAVKPKPHGATRTQHPSDTSDSDTTTDGSSGDAGVAMNSQPKPRRGLPKRTCTPDDGTGDDDTGSEKSEIIKSSEGELIVIKSTALVDD